MEMHAPGMPAEQKPAAPARRIVLFALFWLIVAVGGGVLLYQQGQLRDARLEAAALREALGEGSVDHQEGAPEAPPLIYATFGFPNEIRQVEPGGEEKRLLASEFGSSLYVYAVPKVGFDGRIFLLRKGEGDDPTHHPFVYNIQDPSELARVSFAGDLPFVGEAQLVSPDETKILALYDNPSLDPKTAQRGEVAVWDMLSGQKVVLATVAPSEYLAQQPGDFAGAGGFSALWIDRKCVEVSVFKDWAPGQRPPAAPEDSRQFKERRKLCLQ